MTDSTNNGNNQGDGNIAMDATTAAIDRMVASGSAATVPNVTPSRGMKLEADGTFSYTTAPTVSVNTSPHNDLGPDHTASELATIDAETSALRAQLQDHVFDPKTGVPSHTLTGREREVVEARLKSLQMAAVYSYNRGVELMAQRQAAQAAEEATQREQVARQLFTKGDPARAAAFDEAMTRAEADEAARAIISARRGRS